MFESFLANNLQLFIQLIVATFLGGVIGIERTLANKVAGLRTYAFVSLGSCLLIIISTLVTNDFIGVTTFDPLRVAAAIIMGVGFLCGGIIVYHENKLTWIVESLFF